MKLEELIYKYAFSDSLIEKWENIGEEALNYLATLKQYVHELLKVRNKFFSLLRKMQEHYYAANIYQGYTKDDMKKLIQISFDLKGSEMITPHSLWGLKKVEGSKPFDEYEDDEMSDFDDNFDQPKIS